jgi:hypothetical protein
MAAVRHLVRPPCNRPNPQSEKRAALLSAVKPAESGFTDCSVERRDQTRGARRCDPAPILMERTDELQNDAGANFAMDEGLSG